MVPGVAAKIRRLLLADFNLYAIARLPLGVFEPYTDIETNVLFFEAGPFVDVQGVREEIQGDIQFQGQVGELLLFQRRQDIDPGNWSIADGFWCSKCAS